MNKLYAVTVLALAGLISGCSHHYYAPALYNNYDSYLPKPLSTDSVKTAIYATGGISSSTGIDLFHDYINIGQFDVGIAHSFKYVSIACGMFGFIGTYGNGSIHNPDPDDFDTKSFSGIGTKASVNLNMPLSDKIDFRFLGIEMAYSKEFGNFTDFRRKVNNRDDFHVNDNNVLFSGGATSEIAWRSNSGQIKYALRGYVGKSFGSFTNYNTAQTNNEGYITTQAMASFFMDIKRFCILVERQNFINLNVRVGYRF
jgi:hypothetical protein